MIALLGTLLANWRLVGLAALAAGFLGLGVYALEKRGQVIARDATIAAQEVDLKRAAEANATQLAAIERLRVEQALELQAISDDRDRAEARAAETSELLERIRHAPAAADAPLSAFERDFLGQLRERSGAAGGAGPGRAPVNPGASPTLR